MARAKNLAARQDSVNEIGDAGMDYRESLISIASLADGGARMTRSASSNIEEQSSIDLCLNHMQVHSLISALDAYSRIWMSQYSDIAMNLKVEFSLYRLDERGIDCVIRCLLEAIRALAMPKLATFGFSGSFGIWNPDTDQLSKGKACNAYDMQQVIRHDEAWRTHPEGGSTVNYKEPWIRGTLPPLVCDCEGDSEGSFRMVLHLPPAHYELLCEALEVNALLLELRLRTMFAFFLDKPSALELASSLENLLANVVDPEIAAGARERASQLRAIANAVDDQGSAAASEA